ncbi:hypothetical protein GPALN_003145 [Globodera pallida]|nr:hypothetical protein GPALN_003145 [Globodera pallida]
MEKETNFAHQMRMLRLENPANNGKIAEIKKEIEQQFVGPNLMRQIEFKFPIYMAIDIIDDIKLGMHYAELLSRDEETRNNAELLLSNRIFSARIWTIFFNTYLLTKRRHISHNAKKKDAKTRQILAQIQTIWRHGLQERRGMQNILPNNTTNDNLNASLAPLHDQWLQLANLYNQMPLVARDERVQIAQPQHQHVRHQLSDEHAENMIRLASTKNAFSDCLQNSLFEGKGTKIRARWFFTFNSEETMGFYDAFVSKYPQIETLTRTELTDDEITQLQIQTYIKFFDRNNNEQIWRRAQFLLNVLAFYQWLKNQMNSLPDVKKIRINMHMELLELFMDSASEVPIDQLKNEDYEINFTKHFNEIRAEVLPKLIPKCDGTSIEAVLAQRNLHDEVLTKLLLNNEFVKQLKTICVDVNRLRQICNDQTRIATQIVTQNCPEQSHGPQIGQENENALNASSDTVFCDDDELSKLARLYQNVMAQQNSVPSDSLNFETAYFYHKTVVKELMDYIGLVQRLFKFDNSNKNVKRMIIQLNVEVAKCDLFANVTDRAQKMENLCLMDSLLAHLLNNGTMFTAIGQWQSFLTEKQFYNNSAVPRPSDADRHWTKPECHKAEVVDSTQHKLFNTPQLITWHTGVVLGHLVQKCPSFVQFVNKIVPKVASISNYGQLYANERILLYKTILGSTDTEAIKVWMCRFEQLVQQQQLEAVRHEMETKWLFFRSAYDIFWDVQPPFAEHETEQKLACAINNFILTFCEDAFLYAKYAEFVSAPSDGLLVLLDIGAYANEIGQRIQMVEELQKIDNKLVPNLCHVEIKSIKDEWAQLLETEYDNMDAVPGLEWKLHQILWKILNFHQNSEAVVENADNEMRNVKAQMHLRKFAMALLADQTTKFGDLWTKIEQKKRQKLLQNISGMRCGHIRFDHLKLRWQKMDAQIQMDQLLFNKLPESEQKSNKNLCPIFPKLSQQLNFVENIKNETKMSENLDNYLAEIVYKNAAEFDEKIKKSLQKIKAIFDAWSEGHDVQLLITGSFLLGTHTIHSDIDLLCIVPGKVIKKVQFFGTDTTQCQQPERVCSDGTNSSLYCQLCQHELVTDLRKFANGPVLMIKFIFDQIPYDVTLVQIPDRKTLPPKMDDQTLEDLMAKFKKPTEINTKMLRVLSSHRSTLFIDNLILDGQNNGDWKQILRTDASLAQQKKDKTFNKNAKNFHMLILMPLVLPVQLNELIESSGTVNPFFVRNPVEQEMPVYTPIFPEQNAASLVTHCGANVIRKAMINALTQIKSADEAKLFEWNKLFNKSIDFVEKYTYFVLINCVGEEQFGTDKFCQFVDGRIRRQIVYDLDPKNGPNIGTHLFPDIYRHKNCAISNKFLIFPFRLNFCTVWLLGINSRVNKAQMAPLLAQFDGTIKRHYLKYNPTQNNESAGGGGGGGKNKRHKEFKMPQIEDIEATFGHSKLALKSILVNKWEMFEML